jgi:protein tyrosine/serine phosphatase
MSEDPGRYFRIPAMLLILSLAAVPSFAAGVRLETSSPGDLLAKHISSMQPISLQNISIHNFGVVDGRIFRGEQPGKKDYAALAAIGVKTIIDLRDDALQSSAKYTKDAGMNYVNIRIDGHGAPTDAQAAEFLKIVNDPSSGVVYVHCAGGRHRTGSMIAVYRMTEDGWSVDQAYKEMLAYDFYTGGGHEGFKTYVFDYFSRMSTAPSTVPAVYHAPEKPNSPTSSLIVAEK